MTIDTEVRVLQTVPIFSGVDPSRLRLLAFASERLTYTASEVVFRQGDASDCALVVLAGSARVDLATRTGPLELAHVGPNALVGEMGVLRDAPRSASLTATSELTVLSISRDIFMATLREAPALALAVMRDLADRLERSNARLASRKVDA